MFAVSPDALRFPQMQRNQYGAVRGYFFAAKRITTGMQVAHGGCWLWYGREKKYDIRNGEFIAFRRRFVFYAARMDGNCLERFERTRWLMKEYRINKNTPWAHEMQKGPGANMDVAVLKVFTKPVVPRPPPPAPASFIESEKLCPRPPPVVPRPPPPAPASFIESEKLCPRPNYILISKLAAQAGDLT